MRALRERGCAAGSSEHSQPSCAVGVKGSGEKPRVFDVPAERCARDLKTADTIDCAHFAMRHVGSLEPGVGKVRNPAGEIHFAFLRSKHRTQMTFLLQDCEHLAQADDSATRERAQ
jgi:hypothetical protein